MWIINLAIQYFTMLTLLKEFANVYRPCSLGFSLEPRLISTTNRRHDTRPSYRPVQVGIFLGLHKQPQFELGIVILEHGNAATAGNIVIVLDSDVLLSYYVPRPPSMLSPPNCLRSVFFPFCCRYFCSILFTTLKITHRKPSHYIRILFDEIESA